MSNETTAQATTQATGHARPVKASQLAGMMTAALAVAKLAGLVDASWGLVAAPLAFALAVKAACWLLVATLTLLAALGAAIERGEEQRRKDAEAEMALAYAKALSRTVRESE